MAELYNLRKRREQVGHRLDQARADTRSEDSGGGGPPRPPDGDGAWREAVNARLARVDGALEGLKASMDSMRLPITLAFTVLAILLAAVLGVATYTGGQIGGSETRLGARLDRVEARIDGVESGVAALPANLAAEFHAVRQEMAQQTSAIANSITATRQAEPPPPNIIVVPSPQPNQPTPPNPKP